MHLVDGWVIWRKMGLFTSKRCLNQTWGVTATSRIKIPIEVLTGLGCGDHGFEEHAH
jgi:hypothetical protein